MWQCKCGIQNAGLNNRCAVCKAGVSDGLFDEIDSLLIRCQIARLDNILWLTTGDNMGEYEDKLRIHQSLIENGKASAREMTPMEELHSKLFFHEINLVKDMDDLQLRSHREELSGIAFEARARLSAVDKEVNDRAKKRGKSFQVADGEDITSDAINKINERQRKINKDERELKTLESFGLTPASAEYIGHELFNELKKANDQIEKNVKLKIPKEVALKPYEPLMRKVEAKLKDFQDKKDIRKAAIEITNRICPECGNEFPDKVIGNMLCTECKTLVCIVKPAKVSNGENQNGRTTEIKEVIANKPFIELTPITPPSHQIDEISDKPIIVEDKPEVIEPKANRLNPFAK